MKLIFSLIFGLIFIAFGTLNLIDPYILLKLRTSIRFYNAEPKAWYIAFLRVGGGFLVLLGIILIISGFFG